MTKQILKFYQILFYGVNNGEQNAFANVGCRNDACRSKTVVTACNHHHRNNSKTFVSIKENQGKAKKVKEKTLKKDVVNAQKLIDLTRVRNFNDKKLFEYNLVSSFYLFDADGLIVESGKSTFSKRN